MNLANVMDEVAAQIDTIAGLRAFGWPRDNVSPPAAIVSYPEDYNFDATYGRGMDRLTLPVIVVVGRVSDRKARDRLGAYCDGSGTSSIKAVVEAGTYTSLDEVRVTGIEFDAIDIAGVTHVAAAFSLDIAGQGA